MNTYPFNDRYMIFDEEMNQYVLTEAYAIEQLGIDLSEQVNERNAVNPEIMIKRYLRIVSNEIYNYAHSFALDDNRQRELMKYVPSLRYIIREAMSAQLLYMRLNGALSFEADKDKQAIAICAESKSFLNRTVPELGCSILYTGLM